MIFAQIKLPQSNKFNQTFFLTQISVFLVTRRRRQSEKYSHLVTHESNNKYRASLIPQTCGGNYGREGKMWNKFSTNTRLISIHNPKFFDRRVFKMRHNIFFSLLKLDENTQSKKKYF